MNPAHFGNNFIQYKNTKDLYAKLSQIKPDFIQGMEPYYGYSRLKIPVKIVAILNTIYQYTRRTNTPYFFHILENIIPKKKYGLVAGNIMHAMAKKYAQNAAFIFYLNNGAKENLKLLNIPENKMQYGLWGIWGLDLNIFKPKKHKFNYELLFVGRLIKQKGIQNILSCLPNLIVKYPKLKLIIVGDGPYKHELIKIINKLSLNKHIFFAGEVTGEKLISYYQNADIFIYPSQSLSYSAEQIGMSNIEAMAFGLPVISTDSGSISEYVTNNITGLLSEEKDTKALKINIETLISNEKFRNKLAANGLNYIRKHFDAKKNVIKLENIIIDKFKI